MLLSCYELGAHPPAHHVSLSGLLLSLHSQNFPGKPSQSELEAGLVSADSRGVEQLLEHDVLPGVVQVSRAFQVVKISQGREWLQENIFRMRAVFFFPSYFYQLP